MEKPHLTITYRWDESKKEGVNLESLGESIIGFSQTLKELAQILKIDGDLSIKVQRAKEGSIEFQLLTDLISIVPFHKLEDYFQLLRFVGKDVAQQAFSLGSEAHQDANEYFSRHPLDLTLMAAGFVKLIKIAKRQKSTVQLKDSEGKPIPKTYANGLYKLINKKHGFRKVLRPFVEGQISALEVKAQGELDGESVIDTDNFEDYLSEDERILPEYESGVSYEFRGKVVGLEQSVGEHIRLRMYDLPKQHALLTAYPAEEKTTVDYIDYYGKNVFLTAEVIRTSLYQKPKLKIEKMRLTQDALKI